MTNALTGRTILVTRPEHQAEALSQSIREVGGTAFEFPALEIEPLTVDGSNLALKRLAEADMAIFISPNAARFGLDAIRSAGPLSPSTALFAIGPGTAKALRASGIATVQTPTGHDSEALLALPALQNISGKRVVIVSGAGGRSLLRDTLAARGAEVDVLECYRRLCPQADAAPVLALWKAGGIDAVTVTSAETLANLDTLLGHAGKSMLAATPLFVPHEKIAVAARHFGIATVITTRGGDEGLVDGLINWFRKTS